MRCEYDLKGNELYTVGWYKGDEQLLLYSPSKRPEDNVHKEHVSIEHSNAEQLTLLGHQDDMRANMELYQGTYTCEVTLERSFDTGYASANVSVAILPQKNPVLDGVQNHYQIGEYLDATCTSAPSLPPAELTFYLNNQEMPSRDKSQQPIGDATVSRLSLSMPLQRQHFPGGSMNLTCRATLPGVELDRDYRTTKLATLAANNQRLAQELPRMSSTSAGTSRCLVSWILAILGITAACATL
ncbi:uncharacterized protein LOC100679863 isoform X2 [Nasonia vitripennis]|nr:uncharacterized protein LOC100679863 isoform X2 [Nasonia vitripennis]